MNILIPKILETSDLVATNLNGSSASEYDYTGSTTYSAGNVVKVSYESDGTTPVFPVKKFEAQTSTALYPPDNYGENEDWIDLGGINKHRMFDEYVDTMAYADGTESTDAGKIVMEIDAGRQDKIALFNLEATSVELVIKDSSSVVLETYTHNLATEVGDWEEYFFKDFETSFDLIQDFIALLASTITITIEHSDSGVYPGLGMLLIGADHDVGQEKMDMLAGFQGFKSASDFQLGGQVSPYPNEETVSADVRVPTEDINRIQRVIAGVRDNVTLYETIDNMYEPFVILGVLQEWSLTYKGDRYCEYSIQIEGIK